MVWTHARAVLEAGVDDARFYLRNPDLARWTLAKRIARRLPRVLIEAAVFRLYAETECPADPAPVMSLPLRSYVDRWSSRD